MEYTNLATPEQFHEDEFGQVVSKDNVIDDRARF